MYSQLTWPTTLSKFNSGSSIGHLGSCDLLFETFVR